MKKLEHHALHQGELQIWQHDSISTNTAMRFAIYLPSQAVNGIPCPVLYWLSGLTCTEQNFIQKSGFAEFASQYQVIVVAPDTSPRGIDLNGETVADSERYDLGQGAGFYVNATQAPWAQHYRMYDYIVDELPQLIEQHFAANDKRSIFGHSMGGHGALMIALRNAERYQSVSAFAPIVAPSQVAWGQQAFSAYLGENQAEWLNYDTLELIQRPTTPRLPILIDQGGADEFLTEQLKPELLQQVAQNIDYPLTLRIHAGYDHSYYFITSFIGEHFAHHAQFLYQSTVAK